MLKGVAVADSDYSNQIRARLIQEYDVIEFDSIKILAQEMATPILLRLGIPINQIDYNSGERLFADEHLKDSKKGDLYSPKSLVQECRKILLQLPNSITKILAQSIDFGKPRLVMIDVGSTDEYLKRGYMVIQSHCNQEVAIFFQDQSFLVAGDKPVQAIFEIINRERLLIRKISHNDIYVHGKNEDLCGEIRHALLFAVHDANLDVRKGIMRRMWVVSGERGASDLQYNYCLVANGTLEQAKKAAVSLLYSTEDSAYVRASDF